jgi:hypothetical protein
VWNGRERVDLEVVETFEAGVTGLAAHPVSGGARSAALAATLDSAALAATLDPAAP